MVDRSQYLTIAALAAVIVLAVSFVAVIVTLNNEIANLKQTQKVLCDDNQKFVSDYMLISSNLSHTFISQYQTDQTIVNALLSTRPNGYVDLIALINNQTKLDMSAENRLGGPANETTLPVPPPNSPAVLCSSP